MDERLTGWVNGEKKGANLSQKEHLLRTLDSPSSNETIYYKAQWLQWQEGSR